MYEFRYLLDRFRSPRAENKDLYFSVKRALPQFRRLVNEQLGWNLIVNEAFIKLEKVPSKAMPWMGIGTFQDKYENTGLSRHFTVRFGRDIMHCRSAADFEAFLWEDEESKRRLQRIQRVYRQLTLTPALYWSEENHIDYDYVKNQRSWLSRYLGDALGGELQIYKNGAFWVLDSENRFGLMYPRDMALADVSLLLCSQLRDQIEAVIYPRAKDDTVLLSEREFQHGLSECRSKFGNGWGRYLRELTP